MVKKVPIKKIIIACCTFKRPEKLKRLLENLSELVYPNNTTVEILIVDNDKEKSAENIVKQYTNLLQIKYIVETNKGLSNARNTALTTSIKLGASHIAFIDDDEIADLNWLINHIEFYNKFDDVYISSGPTYKKFEGDYPDYIVNNKIFRKKVKKVLKKFKQTCGSGNVFFPLNIIQEHNIYFSENFNLSGGEDTDFFGRLNDLGYNISWNYNAVNYEIIDHERANVKWILKRAYNTGIINSYIKLKKNPHKKIFYIIEKTTIIVMHILLSVILLFFGRTYSLNNLVKIIHNIGKLKGAISLKLTNYY